MSITIVTVRGIIQENGEFKPHKINEEDYADSPDIDGLVEDKPKTRNKKPKQAVEPELVDETTEVKEQETQE